MKTLQSYTKTTIYTRKTFLFLVYINKKQYLCRRKEGRTALTALYMVSNKRPFI